MTLSLRVKGWFFEAACFSNRSELVVIETLRNLRSSAGFKVSNFEALIYAWVQASLAVSVERYSTPTVACYNCLDSSSLLDGSCSSKLVGA